MTATPSIQTPKPCPFNCGATITLDEEFGVVRHEKTISPSCPLSGAKAFLDVWNRRSPASLPEETTTTDDRRFSPAPTEMSDAIYNVLGTRDAREAVAWIAAAREEVANARAIPSAEGTDKRDAERWRFLRGFVTAQQIRQRDGSILTQFRVADHTALPVVGVEGFDYRPLGDVIDEALSASVSHVDSPSAVPTKEGKAKGNDWLANFEQAMANLHPEAVEAAASVFMSYLPDNNRANSDADRLAARNIVATYFQHIGHVTQRNAPVPSVTSTGDELRDALAGAVQRLATDPEAFDPLEDLPEYPPIAPEDRSPGCWIHDTTMPGCWMCGTAGKASKGENS